MRYLKNTLILFTGFVSIFCITDESFVSEIFIYRFCYFCIIDKSFILYI